MKPDSTIRALESYIREDESRNLNSFYTMRKLKKMMSECETDEEFVKMLYGETLDENY